MRVGVVSDTHGHTRFTRAAVEILKEERVEVVLHAGDIGTVNVVNLFADFPTHFIFGNNDRYLDEIRAACESAGHTCHDFFGDILLNDSRIALTHGHLPSDFQRAISCGEYAVVCCGHTHVRREEWVDDTLILNPGALYRATPKSLAILELPDRTITFRELPEG